MRAGFIFGGQTSMQIAERLQHYVHFHESLDEIETDLAEFMNVTAEDIQRVAAKYLIPENSFTIIVVPQPAEGEGVIP